MARNQWFQARAGQRLDRYAANLAAASHPPTLFAYSYAALDLFRDAKRRGWRTVLGQIDPGPVEAQIVAQEQATHPQLARHWQPAPPAYWQSWQEEWALADRILVNSSWSKQAMQQAGISPDKIDIVPLAYTPPETRDSKHRTYPVAFSRARPLRVLFLGQVVLRKGIAALLEAAERLRDDPIEFWIVGASEITPAAQISEQIHWLGPIARSETVRYYQQADVFLFPTLSDGFGLTQLEAQAQKLPLIVSRYCGEVVKDRVNGLILSEVSGAAIAAALRFCLTHPHQLKTFSQQAIDPDSFNLTRLQAHLHRLSYANV